MIAAAILAATVAAANCESLVVPQSNAARKSLDITSGDVHLVYIGVRHTFDPADPQWATMKAAWESLHPTIAFYEGSATDVGDSETTSIQKGGEPALTRFLAAKSNVPAQSLEPSRADEVRELLRQFPAEQLVMFYTLRPVMEIRTRKHASGAELDAMLDRALSYIHKIPGLEGELPDSASLRAAFARDFPGRDATAVPQEWFDPRRTSAETGSRYFNDINRASSFFRDLHMFRLISKAAQMPGARIFAEVGADHIAAQERALRCAIAP